MTLSEAALQAQEVDGILGIQPANQSANAGANILADISAADLNNAVPQQQYGTDTQSPALQEAQQLFSAPPASDSVL